MPAGPPTFNTPYCPAGLCTKARRFPAIDFPEALFGPVSGLPPNVELTAPDGQSAVLAWGQMCNPFL